ncbi:Olfactory receptor 6X1 [Platysternon megacephalum]|uniref:Olfactory receptor 6X1 n=1 Tax=Platysternon megacephalum TaxID=55544 RepID=A0A4D9DVW5_9SAUR|nr:Olfactory receptor 6X1 [Platysternon megacephalum]
MNILTIIGNGLIVVIVRTSHNLYTPMYFFLSNLSFLEIWYTTAMVPLCDSNIINYFYCDIGPILKIACTDTRLIELLGFLAAITVILSSLMFTVVSYICIISTILSIPSATGRQKIFSTCASHLTVIAVLYGDVLFMYMRLSVRSSFSLSKVGSVLNTILIPLLNPLIYTIRKNEVKAAFWMASYVYIISTILHIPSTTGWQKAFSTCAAHIAVMSIFYSCSIFMYILPPKKHASELYKAAASLHTVLILLVNPFIYHLGNEKVRDVFKDTLKWERVVLFKRV